MRSRAGSIGFLCLLAAISAAQEDGIGDPTFPTLGNRGYLASHYGLKINYNPSTNLLKGDVTMEAVAKTELSTFSLDFSGFTISAVKLNGAAVPYERTPSKLRIKPTTAIAKDAKFSLETVYSGNPQVAQSAALPTGMTSGWITYAGGAVAVCEPDLAHTWFPCNDHPRNKATFDIDVTTPSPYIGIANGIATTVSSGKSHFVLDKPSMTCMAVVAFGKYGTFKQVGPNNLPITNYLPPGTETQYIQPLQITPKFMQYLSDRIGSYPFSSYGTIILPKEVEKANTLMAGSAIETTSIPVFGPEGSSSPEVLCHELTHQWIGDCVSITNWGDDIWWVEGFAQYSEWLLTELTDGKEAYIKKVKSAYDQFSAPGHWLKPGHLATQDVFGQQSYIGGALTFHALRRTLGDAKFFQTVKEFIAKNRYGNASVKDWIEVASKVSGQDMTSFFDEWLNSSTAPKLPG